MGVPVKEIIYGCWKLNMFIWPHVCGLCWGLNVWVLLCLCVYKWKANNKLVHKYFGQTNNRSKMIPPQRFTPSKDPAQFQAETIYYVPHTYIWYVHCVVADHLADGGRSEWRSHVLWALPKWLHNCCCRNGTKITVAHTFACVKLSHNQYKVTFFIYFYDPAHSAYVRGASHIAPDPSATLCWQP